MGSASSMTTKDFSQHIPYPFGHAELLFLGGFLVSLALGCGDTQLQAGAKHFVRGLGGPSLGIGHAAIVRTENNLARLLTYV